MPERVVDKDHISINGELYRLHSPVQFFLASTPPGKVATGEVSEEQNPLASSVAWSDLTGGIGVKIMDLRKARHLDRCWFSTCWLRHEGQIVLGRRAVVTAQAAAADTSILAAFKNEVYIVHSTTVYLYNNSADTWSSVRTLLATATDWAVGLVGGTETLVIATGSEVDYATDSSTWARNTTDIKYVVFWKDLLWGIDNAGQLYYTDDLTAAWTADAILQLPAGYIQRLFVARGADRKQHIYASTSVGFFIHDDETARFVPTDLELPFHPQGGRGATIFRGSAYTAAGNGVYGFQAGSDETLVAVVGPDRDHGLPSNRRGSIVALAKSHNEMIAALDASVALGVSQISTRFSAGGSQRWSTFSSRVGYSLVLGWDQKGWQVLWQSGSSARPITSLLVSNAYSQYRLWWAADQRVYYMQLPVDVINPLEVSSTAYNTSATLETPWFDAGTPNQDKLALSVVIESDHPTTSETILVERATDYTETYTTLGTISTTGETRYYLGTNRRGVEFRAFKLRFTFARGSTTTRTPTLIKASLVYRKRLRVLYGAEATIEIRKKVADRTPQQQLSNLRTALNNGELVEVTWHMDPTDAQNYYMDLLDLRTLEGSGRDYESLVLVRMAEPEQTTSR